MESRIGEAAGRVWKTLSEKGPLASSQISKLVGLSAELTNQAIGWLAREGKLDEQGEGKARVLKLK